MHENAPSSKSCDPQLLLPEDDWGLDRLGEFAREQAGLIDDAECSRTVIYWRLGLALSLARRHFSRGQWGKYLGEFGIEKTRASKACAIFRTFEQEDSVKPLSVQQAYQQRQRKKSKSSSKKRSGNLPQPSFLAWLREVCSKADFFLDEVSCANAEEAKTLLPAIDVTIDELQKLRDRLQHGIAAK